MRLDGSSSFLSSTQMDISSPIVYIHWYDYNITNMELQPNSAKQELSSQVIRESYLQTEDDIELTRDLTLSMNQDEVYSKAKQHLMDALHFREARPRMSWKSQSACYHHTYQFLHSTPVSFLFVVASLVYMYMVIFDQSHFTFKVSLQSILLALFLAETFVNLYLRSQHCQKKVSELLCEYSFRLVLFGLLILDLILFATGPQTSSGRYILPFRILRPLVVMIYMYEIRIAFRCLNETKSDILSFLFIYWLILFLYSLIGSQTLRLDDSIPINEYTSDYTDLKRMLFIMYVNASTDAYPDNNFRAIESSTWNYIYFILFTFLNFFIFSVIPASLVYYTFRETKIRITLEEQIKQQESLILAYATLVDKQCYLSNQRFLLWMFYIYEHKKSCMEYLTEVAVELTNNRQKIFINDFMHLGKIMLRNAKRLPPKWYDFPFWTSMKNCLEENIRLHSIITHWGFQLAVAIVILLSFINTIFLVFTSHGQAVQVFDYIFLGLFVLEIIVRAIAITPAEFFEDIWNNLDAFFIFLDLILEIFLQHNNFAVLKFLRVFRVSNFVSILIRQQCSQSASGPLRPFFLKVGNLIRFLAIVTPIIQQYFWILLIFFYWYTIICMELFESTYGRYVPGEFSRYNWTANFKTFINAQFVMVQILIDAGWSIIIMDLGSQNDSWYGWIMFVFCLMHMTIVWIIAGLIKGLFWEVYLCVSREYLKSQASFDKQKAKVEEIKRKDEEVRSINSQVERKSMFEKDTILKRKLYENYIDNEMLGKMVKKMGRQLAQQRFKRRSTQRIEVVRDNLEHAQQINRIESIATIKTIRTRLDSIHNLRDKIERQEFDEKYVQDKLESLTCKMLANPKIKYMELTTYPKAFMSYIRPKLRKPLSDLQFQDDQFTVNSSVISGKKAIEFHIQKMKAILGIHNSRHYKKNTVLDFMIQRQCVTQEQVLNMQHNRLRDKIYSPDLAGTIRETFLSQIDEDIIRKAEMEYFATKMGNSFNNLSEVKLEPLINLASNVTSTLSNLLRYPAVPFKEFFQILNKIEETMSNKLYKKGSLFKFVFEVDNASDTWFTVEYKSSHELKIRFVKSGIWIYSQDIQFDQIYYMKDPFNFDDIYSKDGEVIKESLTKLFESFESLAFSLSDQEQFFKTNPKYHAYDIFLNVFDVSKVQRYKNQKVQICKVMLVILTLEKNRDQAEWLPYEPSKIDEPKREEIKVEEFLMNNHMLKNISKRAEERIIESQGLPFAYTVNLIEEIGQIVRNHMKNFIFQVEKAINSEIEQVAFQMQVNI